MEKVLEEVHRILSAYADESGAPECRRTAIALEYLVRFVFLGRPMPDVVRRRWVESGVLTKDGMPNAAMRKWRVAIAAGRESEGALRIVLTILADVYEADRITRLL